MIEKITDFGSLSGVSSPLLPLIFADSNFSRSDIDGAFIQKSENDNIQAVFSLKNTCVTLCNVDEKANEELESFFSFCGVTEILSDKPVLKLCGNEKELHLMAYCGESEEENNCFVITPESDLSKYQSVYNVVSVNGNNFENWFPEFSKKINSHNAFATYMKDEDKVVSVAIAPAVYEKCGVIAGVCTLEEYRKKGYAGKCVKSLLRVLNKNNISQIYLWCEEKNISFYENLNFKKTGKIYFGECK